MTRTELITKIRDYMPDWTLEELEGSDIIRLEYLLRLLEAHSEIERRNAVEGRDIHSRRLGDVPPELTEEDEEILDRVCAQLAHVNSTE
jgi:hypothetical protein